MDAVTQCSRIVRARSRLPRVRTTGHDLDGPATLPQRLPEAVRHISPGAERRGGLVAEIDVDEHGHGALGFRRDQQLKRAIAARVSGRPLRRPSGHRAPGRSRARGSGTRGPIPARPGGFSSKATPCVTRTRTAQRTSRCGNPESWSTAPGPDFIEHQLAHAVRDPNGRAYNRTAFLPERMQMMQAWADCLDRLRTGEELSGSMVVTRSPANAGDLTPDLAYGHSGA